MLVLVTGDDVRVPHPHGTIRLSTEEEDLLLRLFAQVGEEEKTETAAEAIASVVKNSCPSGVGVIISPGVAPWALRAVCAALEAKGYHPVALKGDGKIVPI